MELKKGSESKSKQYKKHDRNYDVIVVGGCVTGVTVAFWLQKAGLRTIIIEHSEIGFLTCGCYTSHLNAYYDAIYNDVIQQLPPERLADYLHAGEEAVRSVTETIKMHNIDCDLAETDSYVLATKAEHHRILERIVDLSRQNHHEAVFSNGCPVSLAQTDSIRISGQYRMNVVKYLNGILGEFLKIGGQVIEKARVMKVEEGATYSVYSTKGKITGKNVIYTPQTSRILNLMPLQFSAYKHYTIYGKLRSDRISDSLCYDLESPSHRYILNRQGENLYITVRGEDHKVTRGKARDTYFSILEDKVSKHFSSEVFLTRWTYVYYKSHNGLPVMGRMPGKNSYISAGYSPDGLVVATLGARILADLILTGASKYEHLFPPILPQNSWLEHIKEIHNPISEQIPE